MPCKIVTFTFYLRGGLRLPVFMSTMLTSLILHPYTFVSGFSIQGLINRLGYCVQRVAPYHTGNSGWKDGPSAENKIGNNGNQVPQEVVPTSHTKAESNTSNPHTVETAMKNVKITPPKGTLLHGMSI